jgi:hypothetical protein
MTKLKPLEVKLSSSESDASFLESPERTLLGAILERAILDLRSTVICEPHIRRDCLKWFISKDVTPFSFLWICDQLDIEAYYIRRMASKLFFDNADISRITENRRGLFQSRERRKREKLLVDAFRQLD